MIQHNEIRDWIPSIGTSVAVALLVIILTSAAYVSARWPTFMNPGAAECRASYKKAKTALDSAIVDDQGPSSPSRKAPHSETCGYWRKTGSLK